jgi:hypothetical protein
VAKKKTYKPAVLGFSKEAQEQQKLKQLYAELQQRHRVSFEAAESLQNALEKELGAELLDTGALYTKDGEQEGPRDLVVGLKGAEFTFRVFHDPRKAETDDNLPSEVAAVVSRWATEAL